MCISTFHIIITWLKSRKIQYLPVFRTPVLTVEQASLETYVQSNNSGMFTHFCFVNSKTVLFMDSVCNLSFSTTSFPTLETHAQRHVSLHVNEMIKIIQQTCLVHGFGHCDYTCWWNNYHDKLQAAQCTFLTHLWPHLQRCVK